MKFVVIIISYGFLPQKYRLLLVKILIPVTVATSEKKVVLFIQKTLSLQVNWIQNNRDSNIKIQK